MQYHCCLSQSHAFQFGHLIYFACSGSVGNDHNGHTDENQRKTKMRMMKSEDYMKVEETLQSQFCTTTETLQQPNWNQAIANFKLNTDHSLNSTGTSHSEEEFFSMTEFPLPALGQPSLLNTVRQETGIMTISPRSTLSNVSLGGSSSSTSTKGEFSICRSFSGERILLNHLYLWFGSTRFSCAIVVNLSFRIN